jgi:hypothetical protein
MSDPSSLSWGYSPRIASQSPSQASHASTMVFLAVTTMMNSTYGRLHSWLSAVLQHHCISSGLIMLIEPPRVRLSKRAALPLISRPFTHASLFFWLENDCGWQKSGVAAVRIHIPLQLSIPAPRQRQTRGSTRYVILFLCNTKDSQIFVQKRLYSCKAKLSVNLGAIRLRILFCFRLSCEASV